MRPQKSVIFPATGTVPVNRMMMREQTVLDESLNQRLKNRPSRGELVGLLFLTLTAIALRIILLRYAAHLTSDEVSYVVLGRNLISGNLEEGLSTYWPPLYPSLIGILSIATGDVVLAGRMVSVLSGGFLIVPVYFLARYLYNKATAQIAALLTLVYPFLLQYSTLASTECLYTLLFTLLLLSGLHAFFSGKRRYFLLTGLIIGGAYLVRPEAFGFAPLMILLIIGFNSISRKESRRAVLIQALMFAAGFVPLALPYVLYLRGETGRWGPSEKLAAVAFGMDSKDKWGGLIEDEPTTPRETRLEGATQGGSVDPQPQLEREPQTGLWSQLYRNFMHLPRRLYREYTIHLPKIMDPAFIFLAGLGLFAAPWSPARAKKEAYLSVFVAATLVGYGVIGLQTRYFIALIPILLCWASNGVIKLESFLCEAEERIRESSGFLRNHRIALRSMLLLAAFLSLAPAIMGLRRPTNADGRDRRLALCVKAQSDPQPRFMAATARIAFFADGRHLYLPKADYQTVIDYARDRKADFLVIEELFIYRTPELRFLLDDSPPPPELRLICHDDTSQEKVRIFQLTPKPWDQKSDAREANIDLDPTSSRGHSPKKD